MSLIQGFIAGCLHRILLVGCLALICAATVGCSALSPFGTVQVQIYSPRGASVVLRDAPNNGAVIRSHDPLGNRLEHDVEEFAVFDLKPGTYGVVFRDAAGVEDAAVYGELEIRAVQSAVARKFCRHAFVPVRLPSAELQEAEHLFPSRDISYTEGLERREFEHIKQGDMIEQVYFVADLERVEREYEVDYYQAINDLDRDLTVLADREAYLNVRYDEARRTALFRNPEVNVEDKIAHERFDLWGTEEPYIRLSRQRQDLQRERESLQLTRREMEEERSRRNALLRSMKIVHRAGALVLATPDLKIPFHESVEQAEALGEVVAVLRVGGRHQYWAFNSDVMADEPMESDHAAGADHPVDR